MKVVRMGLVCVLVVISVTAYAGIEPSVKDTYDSGCVENFDTSGCFAYDDPAATKWTGPEVTACKAVGSLDQRCRKCKFAYDDNGQYKGYSVCAFVGESASCDCKNKNTPQCYGYGFCDYHY